MSKYDFGYKIVPDSTNEWAFNAIKPNSTVLELGPAIGALTKNLHENKNCIVDIIEIDEEAGEKASQFARNSCIGAVEGNVERTEWTYIIDKSFKYDYIVILDVLEHLHNPESILNILKSYLSDDGEFILSIPNIAHNSVIIDLLNNKFNYTKVGLLDDTHLHFFTYDSINIMLTECGLSIYEQDCKQLIVGDNEINNSYLDIPNEYECYLRSRDQADIYQFLLKVKRNNNVNEAKKHSFNASLPFTLYPMELYDRNNNLIVTKRINPLRVNEIFKFELNERIRIALLDKCCLVNNLVIKYVDGEEIKISETNGVEINSNNYIFFDNNPQIIIDISKDKEITISYDCSLVDNLNIKKFKDLVVELNQLKIKNNEIVDIKKEIQELSGINKNLKVELLDVKVNVTELLGLKDEISGIKTNIEEISDIKTNIKELLGMKTYLEELSEMIKYKNNIINNNLLEYKNKIMIYEENLNEKNEELNSIKKSRLWKLFRFLSKLNN